MPEAAVLIAAGHHRGMRHAAFTALVTDLGQDSVDPAGMRSGLDVYCGYDAGAPGYRNGSYSNMAAIRARFPGRKYISVGRDCIDIEAGLASPSDAPGFVNGWTKVNTGKPVCYANGSTMPSVRSELDAAGIARSRYYLWVAAWDGSMSIPGGFDGKQYASAATEDSDSFYDYMWAPPPPPPPPPLPKEIDVFILNVTGSTNVYLYDGKTHHITSPANLAAFAKVLPEVTVDKAQFLILSGGVAP